MKTFRIYCCSLPLIMCLAGISQALDHSPYSLTTRCVSCHPMAAPTHRLAKPSISPKDLPLDSSGKVGCITCHDCITGTCSLRRPSPELCSSCHDCTRGMACVLGTVHMGDSPDILRLSLTACLGCHDGTIGRAEVDTHMVNVLYIPSRQLKSVTDSRIVLVDGKVTCISCHNPYGTGTRLVKSNSGSRLCLTCHRK
ncbi:MAG: hypothetical protein M0Z60_06515 [Nitrospiraceae bacterium]|nr:hypothetical protein [Nitrospiraceae bacterium]